MVTTAELSEDLYASRVERLYERVLRARMVATLERLAGEFRDAGFEVEGPLDMSADDYEWVLLVKRADLPEQSVDVRLQVAESLSYGDGTEGVNIALDIGAYGGEVLGGFTPFNYTPECWVDVRDVRAVVDRMAMVEGAGGAVELVESWAANRKGARS